MTSVTDIHPLQGKFEFRDIGRSKACFRADLQTETDLFRSIKPYLMSNDLEYDYDPEVLEGQIFAGGRMVGTFKRIGERG